MKIDNDVSLVFPFIFFLVSKPGYEEIRPPKYNIDDGILHDHTESIESQEMLV